MDEAMEKEHSSNSGDAMELEKYRHGQMRPQVEQNAIKHDYDQVLSRTELLYAARDEIIEERRTFPRLDEAHPSRSRSQCRDDTVEESVAFLRNKTAELATISNVPPGRMCLGQERSRLTSSAKANRLVDNDDKDLLCTFSTFRPITSAAMTSPNFRQLLGSNRSEYNRERISPRSTITSGCINELESPSSIYSLFPGTRNDIRPAQQQSSLRESPPISSKSTPHLIYRGKYKLVIDNRMDWKNSYHALNTYFFTFLHVLHFLHTLQKQRKIQRYPHT